jgi:hypothetical protein
MPPNPQRENRNSPQPCDSIAKLFGLPTGPWHAPQDASQAAPPRPNRLDAALSWLWRFLVDGFAAYGLAMYPCFEDPSDLFDVLDPSRCEPEE